MSIFDDVLSRFVDLLMSIPSLIFALVVLSVMPVTVPVMPSRGAATPMVVIRSRATIRFVGGGSG